MAVPTAERERTTLDRRWISDPRAEVIARLSADLVLLARAGDMEGVVLIHETIARLLRR